jgi:hypothetical protein
MFQNLSPRNWDTIPVKINNYIKVDSVSNSSQQL